MASTKIYTSLEEKWYKHFHEIKQHNKLATTSVFFAVLSERPKASKIKRN